MKWLNDIGVHYTESCKQVICFYKMGSFQSDYYRYVEKQLVITEGKKIYLVIIIVISVHTLNCI